MSVTIDLSGKAAIVTGAGRGIGSEIARHFARAGANVVIGDISLENAEATARSIVEAGGSAIGAAVDIRDPEQTRRLVQLTKERYGSVDVLMNNAAIWTIKWFQDTTPADRELDIGVCLFGTLNMTHAAYEVMREQKSGSIISMISDSARIGEPMVSVYAAAKGGIMAFTKTLAKEAGRFNVRVNGISPSTTPSPGSESMIEKWGGEDRIKKLYPLRRLGDPLDHAQAALYFASDMSTWVTGQILSVNGGFCMPD